MNSSKSRVIALLLVIPLLLIFVMTSVVETTQIIVDIPVSSVKILGDEIVNIDIATQSNMYQIETELTPKNATNQSVRLTATEGVPGKQKANVKITDDGKIVALSLGSVVVTATAGNGRQAKIQLNFTMSVVSDVTPVTMQVPINVGESIDLTGGEYLAKRGTISNAIWTSADTAIASVNNLGVVKGQSVGSTTIYGVIPGKYLNATTGEVTDKVYDVNYQVDVSSVADEQTGIAFSNSPVDPDGLHVKPDGNSNKVSFNFTVTDEKLTQYGGLTTFISNDDSEGVKSADITKQADGSFQLDVTLASTAKAGVKYAVEIHSTKSGQASRLRSANGQDEQSGEYITTVYVQKGYYSYIKLQQNRQAIKIKSNDQNLIALDHDIVQGAANFNNVVYKSSNPQVLTVQNVGEAVCSIKTTGNVGEAYVWAEISIFGTTIKTNEVKIEVVDPVTGLSFSENGGDRGFENLKTIAGNVVEFENSFVNNDPSTYHFYKSNYKVVPTNYSLGVTASKYSNGQIVDTDIIWRSSNENIATVKNGVVTAVGDGEVTITAYSAYNEMLGLKGDEAVQAQVTLRCVNDAIWVDDYYDLMFAMDKCRPAVLRSDVMLAPAIGDMAFTDYTNYLENYATTPMQTTMDATFYKDNNRWDDAKIRYCVNITNDIYGNGKFICGEYITNILRYGGTEVFRGPLDLVKVIPANGENGSVESAAVKAQDNVVFMVNTPNITICNVELKGCADETLHGWSDQAKPEANLSNFDKVGTVLEIVEDGCNLAYSRVKNGRTVVRIFGKAYDTQLDPQNRTIDEQQQYIKDNIESLRTQTTINNCILEYGREFILKLSSNQIIKNQNSLDKTYDFSTIDVMDVAGPMLGASYLSKYTTQAINKDGSKLDCIQSGVYRGETIHSQYANDVADFYNDYVLTDVILRDSVFSNSGLFCVGFESRFAGPLLFGQDIRNFGLPSQGWANVAGTSLPARLKMEGDVRFYDWKVLENVNSETLIEVSKNFGDLGKYLSLDIPSMVREYQSNQTVNSDFVDLLVEYESEIHINGATAFYGGGKNYSYIDISDTNDNFVMLDEYTVPMSYLPHPAFTTAAGEEPFRFFLYNSKSSLGIMEQVQQLTDNTAYDWVYRKWDK